MESKMIKGLYFAGEVLNIDGETGFMLNVGDVEGMAAKTLELLKDEQKLKRFKANAFKQAQKFSIENIVPQYEAFYKQIKDSGNCCK